MTNADTLDLATDLVMAWMANGNNRVAVDDVPAFLAAMHKAISELAAPAAPPAVEADTKAYEPAVSVRKSLASPDHLISMINGKPYRTLRRHLAGHGLTPQEYKARYNLPPSYPMTAPSYSTARSEMAKARGLGMKAGQRPRSEQRAEAPQKAATGVKAKSGRITAAKAREAAQAHLSGKIKG